MTATRDAAGADLGGLAAGDIAAYLAALHDRIRDGVLDACRRQDTAALAAIDEDDGEGDTIYAIDRVGEHALIAELERGLARRAPLRLVAEGLPGGTVDIGPGDPRLRIIVDPIDGTRGLMYQKRSAWILAGVAAEAGAATRLSGIQVAMLSEVPTAKARYADRLWAIRGGGVRGERIDLVDGSRRPLAVRPSRAAGIAHGFAQVSRFFPGARDELAAIDEEIVAAALGPPRPGKAHCFEDQYISSGGQMHELIVGHDRFTCDLRRTIEPVLARRGQRSGICAHPYDLCAALVAEEAGCAITAPDGGPLDAPLDVSSDVDWVGYANPRIRAAIEPHLHAALRRRGLLP